MTENVRFGFPRMRVEAGERRDYLPEYISRLDQLRFSLLKEQFELGFDRIDRWVENNGSAKILGCLAERSLIQIFQAFPKYRYTVQQALRTSGCFFLDLSISKKTQDTQGRVHQILLELGECSQNSLCLFLTDGGAGSPFDESNAH